MNILGIETSCDETAVVVVHCDRNKYSILGERLYSQTDIHKEYGGVYPTMAKREHQKILPLLTRELLDALGNLQKMETDEVPKEVIEICEREPELLNNIKQLFTGTAIRDIDAIAVTNGPGLAPALWVGVNFARALSLIWRIPVIPVNHMEGHIVAALLDSGNVVQPNYPTLSLLVSGGHTELVLSKSPGEYEKIGKTLDDAAGETFDKVARLLGLDYPGGPEISKKAQHARDNGIQLDIRFPRPILNDRTFNFSYSGLKTAVRMYVEKQGHLSETLIPAIAREFEDAVIETLMTKTRRAIEAHNPATLLIGGGVSANNRLRECAEDLVKHYPDITLFLPERKLSTDNAIMIALAACVYERKNMNPSQLFADSSMSL